MRLSCRAWLGFLMIPGQGPEGLGAWKSGLLVSRCPEAHLCISLPNLFASERRSPCLRLDPVLGEIYADRGLGGKCPFFVLDWYVSDVLLLLYR